MKDKPTYNSSKLNLKELIQKKLEEKKRIIQLSQEGCSVKEIEDKVGVKFSNPL